MESLPHRLENIEGGLTSLEWPDQESSLRFEKQIKLKDASSFPGKMLLSRYRLERVRCFLYINQNILLLYYINDDIIHRCLISNLSSLPEVAPVRNLEMSKAAYRPLFVGKTERIP